jgi:transcription antitermination factor NusG
MEKGVHVRVLRGAFADKVGVISELDSRGGARVMLGLLSTRIDKADLVVVVPETRDRPAIQSSHRKPATSKAR